MITIKLHDQDPETKEQKIEITWSPFSDKAGKEQLIITKWLEKLISKLRELNDEPRHY